MSAKDRVLLQLAPHLVLDGALAAAEAVGARSIVVAVPGDARPALSAVRSAVSERRRRGVKVARGAGHATSPARRRALISHLERRTAACRPRAAAPVRARAARPADARPEPGDARPPRADRTATARSGSARSGTTAHPGSALVTVSGAVARPGVREIPCGLPLRAVLDDAGRLPSRCARCWSAASTASGCPTTASTASRSTTRRCAARRRARGRRHRRPRRVRVPDRRARPRRRLAGRAERGAVRAVLQRPAGTRRAGRRDGRRARAGRRPRAAAALERATSRDAARAACPTARCVSCAAAPSVFARGARRSRAPRALRRPAARSDPDAGRDPDGAPARRMSEQLRLIVDPIACTGARGVRRAVPRVGRARRLGLSDHRPAARSPSDLLGARPARRRTRCPKLALWLMAADAKRGAPRT